MILAGFQSHLFFEDFSEVVDNEVVALIEICAQKNAGLLKVLPLHGLARRVRKEDPVEDRREGAAHDAVDDPVPLGIDHGRGVGLA